MKNNIYKKLSVITFLFLVIVYILYIDNNIHETILNNEKEIINKVTESFNNYVNVCRNGEVPQFYNLIPIKTQKLSKDTSNCNIVCNNESNCKLYTLKNDNCNLYDSQENIKVQCAGFKDQIINDANYSYSGIGFINMDYYNSSDLSLTHIDYLLKTANNIKSKFIDIKAKIDEDDFSDINKGYIINKYNQINDEAIKLSNYYDMSFNLFTTLVPKSSIFSNADNSIKFNNKDISFNEFYKKFNDLTINYNNNKGNEEVSDLEYNRRYLIYTILSFLLLITILVLIFYIFAPNIISNLFIFFYFIGIIFITLFIHLILKQ